MFIGCNHTSNNETPEPKECRAGKFDLCINSPEYTVQNDTLTIYCQEKTDFFNAPDGISHTANAPLLLKEVDNTKPFTFSARVEPTFHETYDAGAIYIFHSNLLWQKFAFEMDERKQTRLVTVRTAETSDDNNHDAITEKAVYMKISSDTKQVGFYYSVEGSVWQLVRLYRNVYPAKVYMAISAQSPIGKGTRATFSNIKFTENCIGNFRLGL